MVRLREVPRTAAFAWSPGTELPWIATGTKAGAVDADFSTETSLELWDLDLGGQQQAKELQPVSSIATDSRFYDIAWARVKNQQGIIAGALENGSLDLWDADKLMENEEDAFMSRTSKHSGAIKSLQFNPFRSELLATAGAKGELFISDLNNVSNPFRLGTSAARADDFEAIDWNKKVPHILVTGSGGGFVTVWDVKAKKESLTLNNLGRKAVSAVAWDPAQSTKLATAIPDETNPLILVWDLRNSNAPERTLRAHDQGVLSLSWCQQDTDLLLSCGKDNRTICWNPQTGDMYGEFPIVTNWTFETRWNPHYPSILGTASFDGKITVQTIQNTKATGQTTASRAQALDGEAFFNSAQTEPQTAAFSLPKPPKWLERPVGASFGFGGKVVSFGVADGRKSKIRLTKFAVDGGIGNATAAFEKALAEGDLSSICKSRIENARTEEEKSDWEVLQTLIADNPRRKLVEFLGFSDKPDLNPPKLTVDEDEIKDLPSEPTHRATASRSNTIKNNRLSAFFDSSGDGDNFLADLSATKGAKTNNPFQIYSGSESEPDRQITKALILGQFESAMTICLREDRMSDAFMIAICGGAKCIEQAQAAYFSKKGKGPNYVRLLASVVGKNLWDVVYNADLSNWKEVMATLCTFAGEDEFPDLCEGLGDRLEEEMKAGENKAQLRKDASFCYLAGSKLDKVVNIWIEETKEDEAAGFQQGEADSSFSLHAKSLQTLIEKVTVFREVTKFEDTDRDRSSGWKLSALYDKYTEYADVVAAHGFLDVAEKYLDLLPSRYAAAEVARNRVKQATRKAAPASTTKQLPNRPAGGNMCGPTAPRAQPQPPARAGAASPYAPAAAQAPAQNAPATSGYLPAGFQPPQQQQPYGGGNYYTGPGPAGPPRNINASPSVPPPPRNAEGNWNDTPMVTKPAIARRSTPGAGGPGQQFAGQAQYPFNAPAPSPLGPRQRATPPLPPPPKGSAPPRMTSPPTVGPPPQQPERPPSVTRNQYAPPSFGQPGMAPPAVPRGPSPYNPPPTGAPPTNRYAPAAPAQGMPPPQGQGGSMLPPPPGGRPGSQPNPYAPQQSQYAPQQAPYGQQPPMQNQGYGGQPPQFSQPPPQGPPQGPPPSTQRGPSPATAPPPRQQQQSPAPPKHPPGDRSHLPDAARPVFEILNGDMQRVKAKAPASFKPQVLDTEKRLNILFDFLNNETLLQPDTVMAMQELAMALRDRDYETAQSIQLELHTNKLDQCGQWMVGVKRLIGMSRATP
ncbi:MAG: hypothetical protein M1823_004419 [Watsoniomyces obsoletus]|nr:MAG: hypothetical protein M1823_004419 [Watsoniomyces obsoletus]